MKKILLLVFIAAITVACSSNSEKIQSQFKEISNAIKSDFAPDGRSKTWETKLSVSEVDGSMILKGSTTEKEAKEALLKALSEKGISVLDSMVVLPDPGLGDKVYGVTISSVINLRTSASYSSESATQTIMGTPLRLLEKRSYWTRVVTPEGYIAWVTSGSVQEMDKEEYNKWMSAKKLIITTHYTLFRELPSVASTVVSDGVMGNIALYIGERAGFYEVCLPNGKTAFVPKDHAMDYDKWLDGRDPSPANIIATAKQFLGFPYMWGGTSIKAMDCSGFTKIVYYLNGAIILRDASQQVTTGDEIDISNGFDNLTTGDLIFFGSKATAESKERITHVGIYIEDGEFIHSATSVRINSLIPEKDNYYDGSNRLLRAKRMIPKIGKEEGITTVKDHPWYSIID